MDVSVTVQVFLELVLLKGDKKFNPCPKYRILVPPRGSLKISDKQPCPFFIWKLPLPSTWAFLMFAT